MHCFVVIDFFFMYLTNTEYIISSLPVASQSTLMSPVISSAYRVNLESRMLDKSLNEAIMICPYNYYSLFYRLSYRQV